MTTYSYGQLEGLWTTAGGSLRDGRREKLVAEGLSKSEIGYRLLCAKTYPCESQIVHAGGQYEERTGSH